MEYRSNFSYQGHIKDELDNDSGRGSARELPEPSATWANPHEPEEWRQTMFANNHDAHDVGMSGNRIGRVLGGAYSPQPQTPVSEGNTYHVPSFQELLESACADDFHMNSPPTLPAIQARYDLHSHQFGCQAPVMRPDGAFLNSTSSLIRHSSHLPVRHDLQNLSAQESAYALEIGHPYLRGMPAPRVLPTTTMDPSRLQHRPSPMLATQEDSSSESDVEMVNGGGCDHGLGRPLDADDAAGWTHHPDTIGVGIPDFQETKIKGDMRDTAGVQVPVVMHARFVLKKKAARQENCWILYRRNYFGIQGSYSLEGSPDSSSNETLYLYIHNHQPKPIQALFMCMRGVVDTEEGAEIRIVVFNPKRKPVHEGTETPPIEPQRMKPLTEGTTKFYAESTGDRQDHMKVPMNHTFPRNQFRAATQNNGARRTEQQFYHILLELKAEVIVDGVPKMFTISSKMSEALVVRGRCPLSFKDKDKDGPIRDSNRKGGRKSARDRSGLGSRRGSTLQSHREGQTKGPSRGICNKTGNSSRRSTRASSNLPSLIHGTGSRSANTNPVSPLSALSTDGIVNRETIPRLDHELLTLRRECWDGDPPWLDGHDTS